MELRAEAVHSLVNTDIWRARLWLEELEDRDRAVGHSVFYRRQFFISIRQLGRNRLSVFGFNVTPFSLRRD